MAELKTFLFTDIVGSVKLKGEMPGRSDAERDEAFIEQILTPHRMRIEQGLASHGGRVVSTAGDGHFLVFSDTTLAARWAIEMEQSHRVAPIRTPSGGTVAVRISIHLGIPQIDPRDPDNFVGKPVDYAARLNDYATGGQILVSRSVVAVLEDAGMDGVSFHRHGKRELKGIGPVEIYELVYDSAGPKTMRPQPRESLSRQWTVLPATVGLTEFQTSLGRSGSHVRPGGTSGAPPWMAAVKPPAELGGSPGTSRDQSRLGKYVLEERLGSGGMGDVYRARHSQFGRVRAVKVIKQHFVDAGHHEVIRRFYQEIKAVGALEHPNIVVAIDSSLPSDAVHYLVMEYIDGIGADELVARHGPLPVAAACEIARQAARGLTYIHQHNMVHRDIKPSNLMLTLLQTSDMDSGRSQAEGEEQAVVKILDLGLALLVSDDQQRLTLVDNRAMGTAMYMSPEQWKTTSVDIRADIYSLGCTLYHLLAGQPPFWESDLRPEKAHEREPLPPLPGGRKLPESLWELLTKMTAKNPNDRISDPTEVAAALAPLAEGHQLARMVREARGSSPRLPTRGFAKGETLIASSAESDTRLGGSTQRWSLPKSFPAGSRSKVRRLVAGLAISAGVAAIGWLVLQATGRWESVEEAKTARRHALRVAAQFAASEILKEINTRFDILNRLASNSELRQWMLQVDRSPTDEAAWNRLEDWLGARKADYSRMAPSDSWFINDARGIQVARSPRSSASRGENYAFRDYFHGQGRDLPESTQGLTPIGSQHLSAVYRSTSTGHLKVSFSAPIENGRSGAARKTIGVLAMSVDLGEFNVLEKQLPPGQEVVLIDLRESTVDGQTRRGLILHHQHEEAYSKGEPPPWVGAKLMARIDHALAEARTQSDHGAMLIDYRDEALTDDRLYWGAMQQVIDRRPDDAPRDIRWLVLVQEPASR